MNEAVLKSALVKHLRESLHSFVIIRHEDRFSHGIPDISIDGNKVNSWIEIKFANPGFKSKGIQELTMLRLALATHAFYAVYYQKDQLKRTYIVEPKDIGKPISEWMDYVDGFNHHFVLDRVRKIHDYNRS